jgi:hypothetical protein
MRTVIILSLLALMAACAATFCAEPVKVGGDFGTAWLNNLPYQPETSAEDNGSGLWGWGGVPTGMKVVNGTLQPVINGTDEVDYAGIAWLGAEPPGQSVSINGSEVPIEMSKANYLYPFYSDDPWILAQHYGRPVRTNLRDLPEEIQKQIQS